MDPVSVRGFRPLVLASAALCYGAMPPCLADGNRPDTIISLGVWASFEEQRAERLELRREVCLRFLARQPGRIIIIHSGIDASSRETLDFNPSGLNGMMVEKSVVSSQSIDVPPAQPEKGFLESTFDELELIGTDGEPIPLKDAPACDAAGRGGTWVKLKNSKAGTSERF